MSDETPRELTEQEIQTIQRKAAVEQVRQGTTLLSSLDVLALCHMARRGARACDWSLADEDSSMWETACGNVYTFIDDGPIENGQKFCGYCGGKLVVLDALTGAGEETT